MVERERERSGVLTATIMVVITVARGTEAKWRTLCFRVEAIPISIAPTKIQSYKQR
jgi:hypothetical protein